MPKKKPAGARSAGTPGWMSGEWIDESVPDLRSALPDHIDADAVAAAIRGDLAFYRAITSTGALPTIAQERKLVAQTMATLKAAGDAIESMPPMADVALFAKLEKWHGLDWHQLQRQLIGQLRLVSAALDVHMDETEAKRSTPGRPDQGPRDQLLAAVVGKLRAPPFRIPATPARKAAADILRLCNVPAPTNAEDVRTLVRREGRK